jgi:hypothetical protein
MELFHGSPERLTVLVKGSFVTPMLGRAAKYARYPSNGQGVPIGFIYSFDAAEDEIDWDERPDCRQGRLKRPFKAARYTVCDMPLNLVERDSPIRIRPDHSFYWNMPGKPAVVWSPIE